MSILGKVRAKAFGVKLNQIYGRIDCHQHIVPKFYADWLKESGISDSGGVDLPDWSPESAIEMMDNHGIAKGILSLSCPGVNLGNTENGRIMARKVNEYKAEVVKSHEERFGFFACLNLPDVDGSLKELEYAFDTLNANGVVLLANSRGQYLGQKVFEPLMEELNRRKAVVFVHPNNLPGDHIKGIPEFAADFLLDTVRAATNLVISGAMTNYPDLKIILSHAGGFLPYAADRISAGILSVRNDHLGVLKDFASGEVTKELKKFYFDTALSGSPYALPSLLAFADPERIVFGSDFPFAPPFIVDYFTGGLDKYPMSDEMRDRINFSNAQKIFAL